MKKHILLITFSLTIGVAQGYSQISQLIDSLFKHGHLIQKLSITNAEDFVPIDVSNGPDLVIKNENQHGILVLEVSDSIKMSLNNFEASVLPGRISHFETRNSINSISLLKNTNNKSGNLNFVDSIGFYNIPDIHVIYTYARFYRRKDELNQPLNFFFDYYVRNLNPLNLSLSNHNATLKISDQSRELVYTIDVVGPTLQEHDHGFIRTGKNDIESINISTWDHTNPILYHLSFQARTDGDSIQQTIINNIGFRDVVLDRNKVLINKKKIRFRVCYLDDLDSIGMSPILDLKKHFFNTIITHKPLEIETLNLCDSIGIYIIQELDRSVFTTKQELIDYFIKIKDHPSLIGWYSTESTPKTHIKLMETLDHSRIIFDESLVEKMFVIKDWINSDSLSKEYIKRLNQPFNFSYQFEKEELYIKYDEYFSYFPKLKTSLVYKDSNDKLIWSDTTSLKMNHNKLIIDLRPFALPTPIEGNSIDISLLRPDSQGTYKAISGSRFNFYLDGENLVPQEKLFYHDISHLQFNTNEKNTD